MQFFNVNQYDGIAVRSPLVCGLAPIGETVYASNRDEARELFFRYMNGECDLKKKFVSIGGKIYSDIICEE
jgi:hypothetical protein